MPDTCENCNANPVDIARKTPGTPTAKLIAILVAHGITSAAEIAEIVGISDRAVRKARNHSSGTPVPGGTTGPELQDHPGTTVPKTEPQFRNSSSVPSRAHATKESPSEIVIPSKLDSPSFPQTASNVIPIAEPTKRANGSRLPVAWHLPDDWRMWARTNFPGASVEQIDDQAAQFHDYWISKPGAQARKLDWEATWRNWCRKGLSPAGIRKPQSTGVWRDQPTQRPMSEVLAMIAMEDAHAAG